MKKIILSTALIIFVGGVMTLGSTGAFFSDRETSRGNTFTAGAIDLKIDNHSYYNGVLSTTTTWELKDLTTIDKFFNFLDLKPGDVGEDTISLHVDTNDAYLCANVKLTSNDDNIPNEPELLDDANTGPGLGELASEVIFVWWADDGDNVLEDDENVISEGPVGSLGLMGSTTVALADSETNIWTGQGGPVPGEETLYIGKAWCFGDISQSPLIQDGLGSTSPRTPANSTGGILCDGSALGNETQTDSLTADVIFTAVQSRNNPGYLCVPRNQPEAKLQVIKIVKNDNGGNNVIGDFQLFVDDGIVSTGVVSEATTTLPAGTYSITETGVAGYAASFSGDCDENGSVTLASGQEKICYVINDDLPASITLIKNVINHGGTAGPTQFGLRVDGFLVQNNTSTSTSSNFPHIINETGRAGYHFVGPITGTSSYGQSCPANLGGSITLAEGETIVCTITNEQNI